MAFNWRLNDEKNKTSKGTSDPWVVMPNRRDAARHGRTSANDVSKATISVQHTLAFTAPATAAISSNTEGRPFIIPPQLSRINSTLLTSLSPPPADRKSHVYISRLSPPSTRINERDWTRPYEYTNVIGRRSNKRM